MGHHQPPGSDLERAPGPERRGRVAARRQGRPEPEAETAASAFPASLTVAPVTPLWHHRPMSGERMVAEQGEGLTRRKTPRGAAGACST
jgi:hypothetical protein